MGEDFGAYLLDMILSMGHSYLTVHAPCTCICINLGNGNGMSPSMESGVSWGTGNAAIVGCSGLKLTQSKP